MKFQRVKFWTPYLVVLSICAILLACDPAVQIRHNSDSIIHVLAASDHWTPFFWGQDRLGMFYSLPAILVSSWIDKLILTNTLQVALLLVLIPVFSRWLFRRKNAWRYGWLSALIAIAFISPGEVFLMAVEHPEYPGGLLPGVGALLLFRRTDKWRWTAIPLMLLAAWVNITVPVFLGGLVFLKHLTEGRNWNWQNFAQKCCLLVGSLLLILIPTKILMNPQMDTSIALAPVHTWIPGFLSLWKNAIGAMTPLAVIIVISTIGNLILNRGRITSASLIVPLGALGFSFFLGMLEHVGAPGHGEYRACYLVPVFIILLCSPGVFIGRLLERFEDQGNLNVKVSPWWALTLPVFVFSQTGLPSKSKIHEVFDLKYGAASRSFIDAEISHIGGISWFIFDHAFYTNHLISPERAIFAVKPLGFRDSAFSHHSLVSDPSSILVGVPGRSAIGPFTLDSSGREFQIQLQEVKSTDEVDIYEISLAEKEE